MKLNTLLVIVTLVVLSFSCSSNNKNTEKETEKSPYAGITLVTEWEQGPGIESYTDYTYHMGSSFGQYSLHAYSNKDKGSIAFVTDENRKVIDALEIPKTELKDGYYISYIGAIKNFDTEIDSHEVDPYYITIYEVKDENEFLDQTHFSSIIKAWHFNKDTERFEEVSTDGLGIQNESYGI